MAALHYKYSKHVRAIHSYYTMSKKKYVVTEKNNEATFYCADVT